MALKDRLKGAYNNIEINEMDEAELLAVFGHKNWNWVDPSEQIAYDCNVAYNAMD